MSDDSQPAFPQRRRQSAVAVAAVSVYIMLILAVTLRPAPWATDGAQNPGGVLNLHTWLSIATWTTGTPREFMLNVLLFVPLGLMLARWGPMRAIIVAAALTLGIEITQIPALGRISDPRDLVANTAGAPLGLAIALLTRWFLRRRRLVGAVSADVDQQPSAN